jgi:hypothetical protein
MTEFSAPDAHGLGHDAGILLDHGIIMGHPGKGSLGIFAQQIQNTYFHCRAHPFLLFVSTNRKTINRILKYQVYFRKSIRELVNRSSSYFAVYPLIFTLGRKKMVFIINAGVIIKNQKRTWIILNLYRQGELS